MPQAKPLETEYEKLFKADIARIRHGDTALTLAADHGGHFCSDVRDQWGGLRLSDDWFHFMHGDVVIQSLHFAPAAMYALQPRKIEQARGRLVSPEAARLMDGHTRSISVPGSPPLAYALGCRASGGCRVEGAHNSI